MEAKNANSPRKVNLPLYKIGKFIFDERTKQNKSLAQLSEESFGTPFYASRIAKIEKGLSPSVTFVFVTKVLNSLGHKFI